MVFGLRGKKTILVLALFFIVGCANTLQTDTTTPNEQLQPPAIDELCFPNKCIVIERALTPEEQARGLMFRTGIAEDEGMLFSFPNAGQRFFWMKNVSFPIDIIWLDAGKKVAGITRAEPCTADPCQTYPSPEGVKYVVEVASGFSEKNGVIAGTEAVFSG